MPRITRVTTRTGDRGETQLASGERLGKEHPRIEACGAVDELASALGVAVAGGLEEDVAARIAAIQNDLFHLGAELSRTAAGPAPAGPRIEERHVLRLEGWQGDLLGELAPLSNFVLPGGAPAAARLQLARAVCRRAERRVVALSRTETVSAEALRYLNRLSDLLFVLGRIENHRRGVAEPVWDSRA